jgi:multiple sugar transport system substrate-binding protein
MNTDEHGLKPKGSPSVPSRLGFFANRVRRENTGGRLQSRKLPIRVHPCSSVVADLHLGARCLALLVLTAAGCSRGPDAAVVELWAMGREGEAVQQLTPEFERHSPGITVRVQQIPWSAAHEKLLTAFVGEAMPDLFQLGNTWIPELVALGALEPLDAWVAESSAVPPEDYFGGILDTNLIDGVQYGVPWYVDTRVLFLRRDILAAAGVERPPRDWLSWVAAMTRIRERRGRSQYAALFPLGEWQLPVILALQRGARLLRENDRYGDFRSREFRQALQFYLDLFRRGLAPRAGAAQVANLYQDFAAGYFAFYVSGPWNIGELRRRLPPALQGEWSTAPLPAPDGTYPGISLAGGASLAISRGSRRKAEAWKLIEYLSQPAQQIAFYRLTGDLPARRSAWDDAGLAKSGHTQAFWLQLQHVRSTPKIPEWERIAGKIGQYAEAAIRESLTVEECLARLDADVDRILEKRRWLLQRRAASETAQ